MFGFGAKTDPELQEAAQQRELAYETNPQKNSWDKIWPAMTCGAGLFSDGYVNNVIGSVNTVLTSIYGKEFSGSKAKQNVSSIAFAGTVVGQLVFGYTSDHWSRRNSLLVSTVILIIFTILASASYSGGSVPAMFTALTVYRFFVGIGIGGEYPAGSVACAESTGELRAGTRNRFFVLFTNFAIDFGFVVGAFVPYVVVLATTDKHLRAAWRIMLAIGAIFPISLFFMRLRLQEPEAFKTESMRRVRTPYWLALKFYGPRLVCISLIWFIYDFSTYSFGIYSSTIITNIQPEQSLAASFGWNTVINLFYIPGALFGSFLSDWIGPRYALIVGVTAQSVVGYIMAGLYNHLAQPANVAGFCVVYGIFLSLGEVGPGDNIGLLAAKTSATGVRGQYYGIAAAIGKIGAFVGNYIFPDIEAAAHNGTQSAQYPFWVSSSLCILSAIIAFFFLPNVNQDTIALEDIRFRDYLESQGWDTSQMGLLENESAETVYAASGVKEPIGGKPAADAYPEKY